MTDFIFTGFLPHEELANDRVRLQLKEAADADHVRGWVPACYYTICRVEDGLPVGKCDLRLGYNELIRWGGNIGYSIEEPHRGNGYAGEATKLLLNLAHRYGMPYVHLAVNTENLASQRVCEKLGGLRSDVLIIPETNDRYREGERTTYLYRFDLPYRQI